MNLGLASWALLSVFLWRHSEPQFLATVVVGVLVAIVAPFQVASPRVRKIVMTAGALLAAAAIALPHSSHVTLWNNVAVGLALAAIAFFGPPHGIVAPSAPAAAGDYEALGM
ncbi:MAG TPA: hypothetical protein VHJ20_22140 [Polyangia bacterium]|nr:hypothetical protein [Polyangia bacterium]